MKTLLKAALCLGLLSLSSATSAANFNENFEGWAWHPASNGYCAFGTDCFGVMGCGNGKPLFIRRLTSELAPQCGPNPPEVQQWTGGETLYHGNDPGVSGTKTAIFVPSLASNQRVEFLSTRALQTNTYGSMSVDFYVHGPSVQGNHHVALMHNVRFGNHPSCAQSDCTAISFTRAQTNVGNAFDWIGFIAGGFGEEFQYGGTAGYGFVVERACAIQPQDGDGHLIDSTFIPFTDAQGFLPGNRWYRLSVSRQLISIPGSPNMDYYAYSVYQRVNGSWQPIGQTKSVAANKLNCGDGALPLGYGAFGALPDFDVPAQLPDGGIFHYDVDNFVMNW
ncbi:hypothetical protein [Polyangium aurulentum]|uniref:hypothetical protein n=1 Tax=Polyangium aurulentum TaxID=2567896 RepID=UPI0010ADEF98|nr:hypothetical protein [Polyangium aurulentum]UQA59884.1 hypothetical protein E8A73_005160 [Polyangium aurulentum]